MQPADQITSYLLYRRDVSSTVRFLPGPLCFPRRKLLTEISSGAPLTHAAIDEVLRLLQASVTKDDSDDSNSSRDSIIKHDASAASGSIATEASSGARSISGSGTMAAVSTGSLSGGLRASVVGPNLIIDRVHGS